MIVKYLQIWLILTNIISKAASASAPPGPDTKSIRFWVFSNPNDHKFHQEIKMNNASSLKSAKLSRNAPTMIIIHGWDTNFTDKKTSTQILKNAYLLSGYRNIIAVDWFQLAQSNQPSPISYRTAVENVPKVGVYVAKFLNFLLKRRAVGSPSKLHVIGHSLGAHVAGVVGSTLKTLSHGGRGVGRITGLDPAFPLYFENGGNTTRRLDKSDAAFVDVLHTNVGLRGYPYPCGSVDFYANGGGPYQPFCLTPLPMDPDPHLDEAISGSCSHRRAYYFFAQTISNSNKYFGCQCEQLIPSNATAAAQFNPLQYQCNRIVTALKKCRRETLFGQYVSERVRGSYDMDIQLKDPSKYYE